MICVAAVYTGRKDDTKNIFLFFITIKRLKFVDNIHYKFKNGHANIDKETMQTA